MRSAQNAVSADEVESTRLRLTFLTLLVVSLFVLLFARLWFLQVMAGERYADLAEGNAVSTVSLEAPRGKILDRDGEVFVGNRYVYVVSVQPNELGSERERVIADLADLLGETPEEIDKRIERSRVDPLRPKPVAIDVPEELVLYLWENQSTRYPGVYAEMLPRREYPHGTLAAHVLGYLGEISEPELDTERYAGYRGGDLIGRSGVEYSYESSLRGIEGLRRLEVNARNHVVRQIDEILPTPGGDLRLALDLDLQAAVEAALAEQIEVIRGTEDEGGRADGTFVAPGGAVVVMDVDNGEVFAMASYPTWDPSEFVGGVSQAYYSSITGDDSDHPMINRAIQSSYPPGSVYKIVGVAAALENGYMTPSGTLPCPGSWTWGQQRFNNWKPSHSGNITLAQSLVESCDTVYYELARLMWQTEEDQDRDVEIWGEESRNWGLGSPLGIDLPNERAGVIPGRVWKRNFWENARSGYCAEAARATPGTYAHQLYTELCSEQGATWRGGDAVNMSIGQGDVQATPLQIAAAFAAVANGGTLYRPRVGKEVVHADGTTEPIESEVAGYVDVSESTLAVLRSGLEGVTAPSGTAGGVFGDFPVKIAGKTGTAENGKTRQPFAWFAGYNVEPDRNGRRYVVVGLVEEGGGGSQTGAPLVRRVFEALFGYELTDIEPGDVLD